MILFCPDLTGNEWIYCDAVEKEERNLANVYDTVTAWMPLPEPYRPEE